MKTISSRSKCMLAIALLLMLLFPSMRNVAVFGADDNRDCYAGNRFSVRTHQGRIAFNSNRDGNWEIYVMNGDGTGQTRLTNNPAEDFSPAWSPDGLRIAFSSKRDGNPEIYIMNADGTGQTRLTNSPANDVHPTWSPDGTRIAFETDRDGNSEIYVMNADGSGQIRLTNNSLPDGEPGWSPNGLKIAYISYQNGNYDVYVMNHDGTGQTRLTNTSANEYDPSWSPDSSKIVFESTRDGTSEIYVMNADGTNQTRLTYNTAYDAYPTWSPDGLRIAFMSDWEIYSMNTDGTGLINLSNNPAADWAPDWGPVFSINAIVAEARLDIGMPYNTNRGCSSPYVGCGGPYHGFYNGVCTDLAMDAYNAGVPFNIQNALYQDHRSHPGRYRYGTARNAEDMRRYFSHNQQLLPHSQTYQLGDIAFFDWNGDGLTNHVSVISEVDASGRPLRMVDATGVYNGNPSGRALEHSWNNYYDQHVQAHGRLSGGLATFYSSSATVETLQALRVTVDSPSVALCLRDANGRFTSDTYDENLVASNIESFIPYIPGGAYADLGTGKVISVTQPLSNTTQYLVELTGEASAQYHLSIQTLQDGSVTASAYFTGSIALGETQGITLQLSAPSGVISFVASTPAPMPKVSVTPSEIEMTGLPGASVQTAIAVAETGGQQPLDGVFVSVSDVMNQNGQVVAGTLFTVTPASFNVPAGSSQDIQVQIDLTGIQPGIYQGNLLITSINSGTRSIPLSLLVRSFNVYLPVMLKNTP